MRKITFTPLPFNFWDITGVFFVGNRHELHRVGDQYDYETLVMLTNEAMQYAESMIPDDAYNGIERVEARYMMQTGSVPVFELDFPRYLAKRNPLERIANADMCSNEVYKAGYTRGQG